MEDGTFGLAYELRDSVHVDAADRGVLAEHLSWFEKNLERLRGSTERSRKTRGIAWFKDTATEHLTRMHQVNAVLEEHGYRVTMLVESRVGYRIHEDTFQVIAEPSSDTQTG